MFVKYSDRLPTFSVCLFYTLVLNLAILSVHFVPMVLSSCSHAHASPDLGTAVAVTVGVSGRENTIMGPSTKVNYSKEQPA